jgi:hypothetical protein
VIGISFAERHEDRREGRSHLFINLVKVRIRQFDVEMQEGEAVHERPSLRLRAAAAPSAAAARAGRCDASSQKYL